MNDPGAPRSAPDFDAERCLQALRGEPQSARPQDRSARAGRLLRELVLAELQAEQADPNTDEAGLLARLRASGAFAGGAKQKLGWPSLALAWLKKTPVAWLSLPALATVAGVGFLLIMQQPLIPQPNLAEDDAAQMRGAEQAQRLPAADPAALADALQALLAAHQVALRRQTLGSGQIELQAKIPPGDAPLWQALADQGVSVPAHGRLWLLIAPSVPAAKP